jgi:hypothetical protein
MSAYTDLPTTLEELYRAAGRARVDERQFSIEGQAILEVNTRQHIRNGTIDVLTAQGWQAINGATPVAHNPRNIPMVVVKVVDQRHALYNNIDYAYPEQVRGREWFRIEQRNPRITHRLLASQVQVLKGSSIPLEY